MHCTAWRWMWRYILAYQAGISWTASLTWGWFIPAHNRAPSCRIPIFSNKWDYLDCQKYKVLFLCLPGKYSCYRSGERRSRSKMCAQSCTQMYLCVTGECVWWVLWVWSVLYHSFIRLCLCNGVLYISLWAYVCIYIHLHTETETFCVINSKARSERKNFVFSSLLENCRYP